MQSKNPSKKSLFQRGGASMKPGQELVYQEFINRENEFIRAPYDPELAFYALIKAGDLEAVKKHCKEKPFVVEPGWGVLSKSRLQNAKYHFVITTAILARYCIQGGLPVSVSYSVSDLYIQKADQAGSAAEITQLHATLCMDYAKRMKNLRKKKIQSRHIAQCLDYIYEHLHTRITVEDLSDLTSLSPDYLSRLFKRETGQSVSEYIRSQKILAAQNMLIYSDYSPGQIAQFLAFNSQSYFTEVFRQVTGQTPTAFRNENLHSTDIGRRNDTGDSDTE